MAASTYKRKDRSFFRSNYPTPVNIYWSQQYSSFALKFMDTHHFDEMSPIMNFIKSNPYGEYLYDPDNKIWYFHEKHLAKVRMLVDAFGPTIFTTNFTDKPPVNNTFSAKTISVDDYLQKFQNLTGDNIKDVEYTQAKKIYRRACLRLHPDHNPNSDPAVMSSVNEIWTELERLYFKTRNNVEYEQTSTTNTTVS